MRLIFDRPGRPNDRLVIGDLNLIVNSGEQFDAPNARGRQLLAELHPDVREAPQPKPAKQRAKATQTNKRKATKATNTTSKPEADGEGRDKTTKEA